jgi:hypothetical protein
VATDPGFYAQGGIARQTAFSLVGEDYGRVLFGDVTGMAIEVYGGTGIRAVGRQGLPSTQRQ